MSHWCEVYLGRPWVRELHDCWQFFRVVQREQFGVDVPNVEPFDSDSTLSCARALQTRSERGCWQPVALPREGDAVLLARSATPTHVGIWVEANNGAVLHCVQGAGVVLQGVDSLKRHGWGGILFFRREASHA